MRKRLLTIAAALALAASAFLLTACSQGDTQAEVGQTASQDKQSTEEIYLREPVPTCGLEACGQWNAWQGVVGGVEIYDGATQEKMEFEEIVNVYQLFDVQEYDIEHGNHEWPTNLHVTLADGTEGDIANADVINDLWHRILRMRLSPDLAMDDPGTFRNNVFVFSWDDGRTQTFTFTGDTALTVDGTLFPVLEGVNGGGEIFNGWSVTPAPNYYYPDLVFDIARMVVEDGLGKRDVFFITYGSTRMDYSEDSLDWDANRDNYIETYSVERVRKTDSSPGGIRLTMKNVSKPLTCLIEGATRLYVVEMMRDDEGYTYPEITYQPEDSEERATCSIKLVDGELVVDYL